MNSAKGKNGGEVRGATRGLILDFFFFLTDYSGC